MGKNNISMDSSPFRGGGVGFVFLRSMVRLFRIISIKIKCRSRFSFGAEFSIGKSAEIKSPDFCIFGDRVGVGKFFSLESNLIVGNDVLISSYVSIVGNDHKFNDPKFTVYTQGRFPNSTARLEGNNLIGYGVTIVGNVTVGSGCIIGAGSVVVSDLPKDMICVGVPARPIKNRYA